MSARRAPLRPSARKAAIFEFVEQMGRASVEELAHKFGTSQETVRRDLNTLANKGHVRKIHGGVVRLKPLTEDPFEQRLSKNILAKQLIAEKLGKAISPNQTVFMDTGSTTLICAEVLARIANLTVITNSTQIAETLSKQTKANKIILLGGTYRAENAQTIGPTTIKEINEFRADHAILTVAALDDSGIFDADEEEAHIARAMIKASQSLIVLCDQSKLENSAQFHLCDLDKIDVLICDKTIDGALGKNLDMNKVKTF